MAPWLPLLKASLPYVTQLITAAIPAFTSKPASGKPDDVIPKQISELQSAVTHNAESVKALATQLKQTIEGIDAGAEKLQNELQVLRRLAIVAVVLAVVGISVALWALIGKAHA
jgi:hypothetical protein